jgi:hypothetical protein
MSGKGIGFRSRGKVTILNGSSVDIRKLTKETKPKCAGQMVLQVGPLGYHHASFCVSYLGYVGWARAAGAQLRDELEVTPQLAIHI